jgi:probable rRNA maturation factor
MIVSQVFNRQRKVKFDLPWLRRFTQAALPVCLESPNGEDPVLPTLLEVEIAIVSDPAIARVHAEFMQDPTPTDVITFEHGEILVSADTARFNAERFQTPLQAELGLYIIHGLLHLNGFVDKEPEDAALMHRVQNRILKYTLEQGQ